MGRERWRVRDLLQKVRYSDDSHEKQMFFDIMPDGVRMDTILKLNSDMNPDEVDLDLDLFM